MNGDDGVHLLSSSEVEELIHKAEEASMTSHTVTTVTVLQPTEVLEEAGPKVLVEARPEVLEKTGLELPELAAEVEGLEASSEVQPSLAEASAEKPVTMVFMGYQNVEDEGETKKVLGLQGTVKAELVLIEDADGKTSPGDGKDAAGAQTEAPPTSIKPPEMTVARNGETAGETAGEAAGENQGGAMEIKKEKQPCKCCSIM